MTETMTTCRERRGMEEALASDLWRVSKDLTPMSPEEEYEAWRKTTRALDSLCDAAGTLTLDPLILALASSSERAGG